MRIRPAQVGDGAAIAALWNPLIRATAVTFSTVEKTVAGVDIDIAAAAGAFFVALDADGALIGFAQYGVFRGGPGYAQTKEHTIILSDAARGRGVGRALMAALCDQARASGVHSLIAAVSGENPGGVAFHRAVGFEQVAVVPEAGFKFGRWMDLVLLQKIL